MSVHIRNTVVIEKSPDRTLTETRPPKDIFDVLHKFEELGGTLPKSVDDWWAKETFGFIPDDDSN